MYLPDNIIEVSWIKYDCREYGDTRDKVKQIKYKTPDDFMYLLDQRVSDASEITVIADPSGVDLKIYNDRGPTYYTSFDNETIVFDSYDIGIDSTLQTSKVSCYGKVYPTWTMTDEAIPDLPTQSFSYLLNEAKSTAMLRLKQTPDQKAEQHSITQRRRQSQDSWRVSNGVSYPNYGRTGKK